MLSSRERSQTIAAPERRPEESKAPSQDKQPSQVRDDQNKLRAWKRLEISYKDVGIQQTLAGPEKKLEKSEASPQDNKSSQVRKWKQHQVELQEQDLRSQRFFGNKSNKPAPDAIVGGYQLTLESLSDENTSDKAFYRAVITYLTIMDLHRKTVDTYQHYPILTKPMIENMLILQNMIKPRGSLEFKKQVVEKIKNIMNNYFNPAFIEYQKTHAVTQDEYKSLIEKFRNMVRNAISIKEKQINSVEEENLEFKFIPKCLQDKINQQEYKNALDEMNELLENFKNSRLSDARESDELNKDIKKEGFKYAEYISLEHFCPNFIEFCVNNRFSVCSSDARILEKQLNQTIIQCISEMLVELKNNNDLLKKMEIKSEEKSVFFKKGKGIEKLFSYLIEKLFKHNKGTEYSLIGHNLTLDASIKCLKEAIREWFHWYEVEQMVHQQETAQSTTSSTTDSTNVATASPHP